MRASQASLAGPAEPARPPAGAGRGTRRATGFVQRTLASLSEAVERDLVAEELARRGGWLQRADPRAKVVGALALVVVAGTLRHLAVLAALYLALVGIGLAARLPSSLLVRRVWVALPFFTAVVVAPAVFSFVTPGPALLPLGRIGGADLAITAPGVRAAATLLLRVAASVTAVLLLALSTRWPALLKALRVLRVPQVLILILLMTYRYIFLLARLTNSLFLARQSRSVGPTGAALDRRWLAATAGTLLGKSYHLSNEVYLAMLARGFRGEPTTLDTFRMRRRDWGGLAAVALLGAAALLADRVYPGPW